MSRRKYKLDFNVLFAVKVLKHVEILKTWKDVADAYYDITKNEIPVSYLRNYANKIVGSDLSANRVSEYISSYVSEKNIKIDYNPNKEIEPLQVKGDTIFEYSYEDESEDIDYLDDGDKPGYKVNNGPKTVKQALGITEEDEIEKFGILPTDDELTRKSKIMKKLADQDFLLNYLGYNKDMFYIATVVPGAWTTPMKLKVESGIEIPVIITNDKFSIVIKQNPNIKRDYEKLAVQTAKIFKEMLENIKFPNVVKRKNLGTYRDTLVTQHVCDLHMGSLINWTETSYDNWDSKKATHVLHKITDYTIEQQVNNWNAKTLYYVLNGDFFDIDNKHNKTTKLSDHTMQTDQRWQKLFSNGAAITLYNLTRLSPHFEEIVFKVNGGNHDLLTSNALFMVVASSILSSKFSNINVGYDRAEFLKESYFPWGNHLFLSDHGEKSDDTILKNLTQKYEPLINLYPYINITLGHQHHHSEKFYGKNLILREPSLSPVTSFEAEETALNGKGHPAQFFRLWKKDKRYSDRYAYEEGRRSVWKDGENDPENRYPSTLEEVHEVFFVEGHMQATYQQKELARFFEKKAEETKLTFVTNGIDIKDWAEKDFIQFTLNMGVEIPMHLRTTNHNFVIDNMDKILGRAQKPIVKKLKPTKR